MSPTSTKTPFLFVGGVLHIDMAGTQIRIRWVPEPLAEEKNPRGGWKACWPTFRLLQPPGVPTKNRFVLDLHMTASDASLLDQKKSAFEAFRASIPPEIVALVEHFGSHQWALLELLAKEPEAVDLARANPVLAYALANNAQFRGVAPGPAAFQAMCYCKRKQRWISTWLGFPDSEASVKFLKKALPEAVSPSILRRLQVALMNRPEIMTILAHLKRTNSGVLELVADQHLIPLTTPRLLAEVAESEDDELAGNVACVLSEGLEIIRQIAPGRQIKPFMRMAQVQEFGATVDAEYAEHGRRQESQRRELLEGQERRRQELLQARRARAEHRRQERAVAPVLPPRLRPFPPPPLPGTTEIIPILTSADLVLEGSTQQNCVASYSGRVRKGTAYVYRVTYPERATLSIIKGYDGCWQREQLKTAQNGQVRQSTKSFVDNWLAKYRMSV